MRFMMPAQVLFSLRSKCQKEVREREGEGEKDPNNDCADSSLNPLKAPWWAIIALGDLSLPDTCWKLLICYILFLKVNHP